ncbi:MAG: CTP synthase, partial [Clostridiales bacterium]|nr:CTP synthase [Clostridiales bacterium]
YVALHDSYLSVVEALTHGGIANDVKIKIRWVDSKLVNEANVKEQLSGVHGIIVPGGFGDRGIQGMIDAIHWARVNNVPSFGICLGMQMTVVEYARNMAGLTDAHSSELCKNTPYPVIDLMPEQRDVHDKGASMRLGAYPCKLTDHSSHTYAAYGKEVIYERHRHRYEFNNGYREILTKNGLKLVGLSPNDRLVEVVEVPNHPWMVGVQFHPELKSRPNKAHPLFRDFIRAAKRYREEAYQAEG